MLFDVEGNSTNRKTPDVRNFSGCSSRAGSGCANFMGAWDFRFFPQQNLPAHTICRLRGVISVSFSLLLLLVVGAEWLVVVSGTGWLVEVVAVVAGWLVEEEGRQVVDEGEWSWRRVASQKTLLSINKKF